MSSTPPVAKQPPPLPAHVDPPDKSKGATDTDSEEKNKEEKAAIAREAEEEFAPGSAYDSIGDLLKEVRAFGEKWGFTVRREGMSIVCGRAGNAASTSENHSQSHGSQPDMNVNSSGPGIQKSPDRKKRRTTIWMKVGCSFKINCNYVERLTVQDKAEKKKRQSSEVKITKACYTHCDLCIPSHNQLIHCKRASGALTSLQNEQVCLVINMLNTTPNLPASVLRNLLAPCVPSRTVLQPQDLVNFRLWAKRNHKKLTSSGQKIVFSQSKLSDALSGKDLADAPSDLRATYESGKACTTGNCCQCWTSLIN